MNIVVFGAHPDDMEIGMGGTIARHIQAGDSLRMILATIPSRHDLRLAEARRGAEILGAEFRFLDLPAEDLMYNRAIVRGIDEILHEVSPDLIYTHWDQDSHQDHNTLSRAVFSAARKNRCSLLMYEQTIPGGIVPGGFNNQAYVDISDFMELKMESIRAHVSQEKANGNGWLDGVKGRAMYRGYQMNARYAEAFEVVKAIEVQFCHR